MCSPPQLVKKLPDGEEWLYEVKFDGYRALLTRTGSAW
jgi:ATP-dependent DNA ligase